MTHEELLNGRPARISTRSTNGTPRTTCGAVLPGTEPNRHVPANRRFYGARTRERLRRRTVDAPIRLSFFVFVIRRSNNPAAGRAEEGGRWTAVGTRPPAPRPSALAPANAEPNNAPRYRINHKTRAATNRAYTRSRRRWRAMAGRARPASPPRRPPRAGRTCLTSIREPNY
jgi:hypothetical protein